ncbi:MAG: trigger factor [candidate division WS6 bacterium 34_10]|uniref:Trigger factor n=1 Tax=candidate division WS6 bacterium 34_10 TaxID=1641389 RepID=A0A101HIJ2_9BACT|nr:MAG: trigger factor [candidate division WS6 bacterium 34_10]
MSDMYKREDVSDSKIELTITMPRDAFEKSYKALLKDQTKDKDIKGFRKGKVPEDLIEPSMKPMLQFETFERLAPMYINTTIQKEKIELVAPPKYSKLPEFNGDEDLEFKVEVTTMPDFKLGNLKKVKVEKEDIEIEEKDVEKVLKELKTQHETDAKKIGDDWAKEMAKKLELEDVKDLDGFKEKVEDLLKKQKEHMLLHRYQEDALKQAIELSKIEIPEGAIEFEAKERERSFEQDMQARGVKIEEFLKQSNLDMEQMREAWKKDAKDALEADVFLNLYAKEKDVKVSKEELDEKIEMIKKTQPNADESVFSNEQWLDYIKRVEKKEKAFREFIKETLGEELLDEHN